MASVSKALPTAFGCTTVGELLDILKPLDESKIVRLEVSALIVGNAQLSLREDLCEVVVSGRKVVLRGLAPEGWRPESRKEEQDNAQNEEYENQSSTIE